MLLTCGFISVATSQAGYKTSGRSSMSRFALVCHSIQSLMVIMELCVVDFVEANCKIVSEERGLEDICLAMGRHNTDVELVEAACSALWSLSMEGNLRSRSAPVCLFTPNNTDSWFILKRQSIKFNQHAVDGFFFICRGES